MDQVLLADEIRPDDGTIDRNRLGQGSLATIAIQIMNSIAPSIEGSPLAPYLTMRAAEAFDKQVAEIRSMTADFNRTIQKLRDLNQEDIPDIHTRAEAVANANIQSSLLDATELPVITQQLVVNLFWDHCKRAYIDFSENLAVEILRYTQAGTDGEESSSAHRRICKNVKNWCSHAGKMDKIEVYVSLTGLKIADCITKGGDESCQMMIKFFLRCCTVNTAAGTIDCDSEIPADTHEKAMIQFVVNETVNLIDRESIRIKDSHPGYPTGQGTTPRLKLSRTLREKPSHQECADKRHERAKSLVHVDQQLWIRSALEEWSFADQYVVEDVKSANVFRLWHKYELAKLNSKPLTLKQVADEGEYDQGHLCRLFQDIRNEIAGNPSGPFGDRFLSKLINAAMITRKSLLQLRDEPDRDIETFRNILDAVDALIEDYRTRMQGVD